MHCEDTENRKRKVAMKTLKLVLKKQWYDMIASGEKKEEYREMSDYWILRLTKHCPHGQATAAFLAVDMNMWSRVFEKPISGWDAVTFYMGYAKDRPQMTFKIREIVCDEGKREWGAEPGKKYFVIKLGDRL